MSKKKAKKRSKAKKSDPNQNPASSAPSEQPPPSEQTPPSEEPSEDTTISANESATDEPAKTAPATGEPSPDQTAPDGTPADEPTTDEGQQADTPAQVPDETRDNVNEPGDDVTAERIIEAVLFATDNPLPLPKLVSILGTGSAREVRKMIQSLNEDYARQGRAFRVEEIAGGYQLLSLPEYNTWLRRLKQTRQETKLTPAAMETLAVIAYKQPVVRAQIEAIRGVSVGEVINRLRELGLIKIVGRDEDVGRPLLYGTTKRFLEVFGLSRLEDLPAIEELQMPQ